MGEVYRARDPRLGRDVAIKILPSDVAADPDRLARFEREAQVLASLNHPNIAHIYGVDDSAGVPALIMELVDGPTLADRIAKGPIPLDEALPIAKQIAEALEAAHEQGIIHRDLKPANIKVRQDGTVKVLDFGLAKVFDPVGAASRNGTMSPTLSIHATQAGLVLGTAAYMSPEQARGRPLDRRVDIWAFGCILFEMLTGRPAFAGETLTDIVAAVVTKEPNWAALPAGTPHPMRLLIRRCVQKDQAQRLHDIADARIEMQELGVDPSASVMSSGFLAVTRVRWLVLIPVALAVVLVVDLIGRAFWKGAATTSAPVARLELALPPGVELYANNAPSVAVSPDGRRVAFIGVLAGTRQIYVRDLSGWNSVALRGTDTVQTLFFSPDNSAIGFITADLALKRISLTDGLVVTLAHGADQYSGATWGADDRITFVQNRGLQQIPSTGGAIVQLTTVDKTKHEVLHTWPFALGTGRVILFSVITGDATATHIEAVSADTGQRRVLADAGTSPLYASTGHLVFYRDGTLMAAPFDPNRLALTGLPVRVAEDLAVDFTGVPLASLSRSGLLAYAPAGTGTTRIVWVSRQGLEQPVTDGTRRFQSIHLAPDGQKIAVQYEGALWILEPTRGSLTRLTHGTTYGSLPVWTPDGKRLLFRTRTGMRSIDTDGSGHSEAIAGSSTVQDIPASISPDGGTLAFIRQNADTSGDIYVVALRDHSPPQPIITTQGYDGGAQFSPDGRWLAYVSNETGTFQVYVRPFPGPDRRWTVSTASGTAPIWRRDGKELFYRSGNKMMSVDVNMRGDELTLSPPRLLFEQRYMYVATTLPNYDVTADGQRFLLVKDESGSGRVNIVFNWLEELKHQVSAK